MNSRHLTGHAVDLVALAGEVSWQWEDYFRVAGRYRSESSNHAAIYLHQDDCGICVYEQWQGHPVHKRLIQFQAGSSGTPFAAERHSAEPGFQLIENHCRSRRVT